MSCVCVLRCAQAQLAALQPAFTMDPVEKALRMGGVREEAKKLEEDGGTLAGNTDRTTHTSILVC